MHEHRQAVIHGRSNAVAIALAVLAAVGSGTGIAASEVVA
ncbi:hypothetical protein ABIA33_007429 [Streptacidiphilus sp. MAP12-16]